MAVRVLAHAKINLYLDVLKKLDDGYHDIWSITQSLELADELNFRRGSRIQVVSDSEIDPAENLVTHAAEMLQAKTGVREGATIELKKSIPIAAGLGGGSADAAAALVGLNMMWNLQLPRSALSKIAQRLGADVPLCLEGGTLLAEGRGERLSQLPGLPRAHILIAKPPLAILTRDAYKAIDCGKVHPLRSRRNMLEAVRNRDLAQIGRHLENVFEQVTFDTFPEIRELKKTAIRSGAIGALMSGSGPSVFALTESKSGADAVFNAFKKRYAEVIATKEHPYGVTVLERNN